MPRINILQTDFTAGELSPRMKGRRDVARYQKGAERIENALVLVHGGAERRGGFRYCGTAKHSGTRECIVIRYVFNRSQAYVLEFGHLYVRIYDIDGGILVDDSDAIIEVVSPYTEDQLDELSWHQGGDTLFLYHPDVATHRFQRRSGTVWTLQPVPWVVEPFAELGHVREARLQIDNPAAGAGRTFTTLAVAVPGAPTSVVATALNGGARVSFTAPTDTGGATITEYEATSSPGGITATSTGTTITIPGLTNGVAYTFTVKARNSAGQGAASAASNSVTPSTSAPLASITASANPVNSYHDVANGTVTSILGPIATGTTGQSPYTVSWRKVSGSSAISLQAVNAAQVRYTSTGYGETNTAVLEATVTDAYGAQGTVQVNVSVTHSSGTAAP